MNFHRLGGETSYSFPFTVDKQMEQHYLRTLFSSIPKWITNNTILCTSFCFLYEFIIYPLVNICTGACTTALPLQILWICSTVTVVIHDLGGTSHHNRLTSYQMTYHVKEESFVG